MAETNLEAQFAVPALDVQTGTYGSIVLTATLMTVPAELVIYNDELRQYVENIKLEVSQSVDNITQNLEVDVKGRLGYKFTVNNQAGLSYTLQLADEGTMIRMTSSDENSLVVPDEATVPFEVGSIINLRQAGVGTTVVVPAVGVTVNTPDASMKTDSMHLGIGLVKVGPDEWDLVKSFVGVPLAEVEAFAVDLDAAITAMEDAQVLLDQKVQDMQTTLTNSIEEALAKAEQAITNLTDVTTLTDFGKQLQDEGFQRLPGGLILQWGRTAKLPKDGVATINYRIPFPTKVLHISGASQSNTTDEVDIHMRTVTFNATTATIKAEYNGGKAVDGAVLHWFAIGY